MFSIFNQARNVAVQSIWNITKLLPVGLVVKRHTDRLFKWSLRKWFWNARDGNWIKRRETSGSEQEYKPFTGFVVYYCYYYYYYYYYYVQNVVKLFVLRPGQAPSFPEVWCSHISWKLAHEGRKVVSLTHWPPLPQEVFLVLSSVRGCG